MSSKELTALCPYCIRGTKDIWHLKNHILKYHQSYLTPETQARYHTEPLPEVQI